jgi:hypothetical protein
VNPDDELDREARNAEHKIGEVKLRDVCFYFFRGELAVDDDENWYVAAGDGLVVEVYDRAETSIWFELPDDDAAALIRGFTTTTAPQSSPGGAK